MTPTPACSGNADVGRASQVQHAIEHVDRYVHLSRPTLLRVRAQSVPDHALVAADRSLSSARLLYPEAFCQAIRPRSAMSWRWRSRWVGALSAVRLGPAVSRGGTMSAPSGWRSLPLAYTPS